MQRFFKNTKVNTVYKAHNNSQSYQQHICITTYTAWKRVIDVFVEINGEYMDPRWTKYENFKDDMGFAPSTHHVICRKCTSDIFNKENCSWVNLRPKKKFRKQIGGFCDFINNTKSPLISRW